MNTLAIEISKSLIESVSFTEDSLIADLSDGRTITLPLAWHPRLTHATVAERENWRLIGRGEGIHWPELDEDVSIENIIIGRPSGETQRSINAWLNQRNKRTEERC